MARLLLDLVPEIAWGVNLRSRYPEHWDVIRKAAYKAADYQCECCDAKGRVESHEVWDYSAAPTQKLIRLVALCDGRHSAMHYGMARVRGVVAEVNAHIMRVNRWSRDELKAHVDQAFKLMRERNKVRWVPDTSVLDALIRQLDQVNQAKQAGKAPRTGQASLSF